MPRDKEYKSRRFAKKLRRQMTNAEVILWSRLRQQSLHGRKFRRQHPVGPYIADFACVFPRLILEVDGATHGSDVEIARDQRRDAYLQRRGWQVVRITNTDVYEDLDDVLDKIFCLVPAASLRSAPSVRLRRPLALARGVRCLKWSAGPFRSPLANRSSPP